tara:strand:- start:651 stop:1001 length:351 start_codon:yes stop_codon:yes gene_type:complete
MKDTIKRMRPEDFIINVRPDLNDKKEWTGEVDISIMTAGDNPLGDDDYYGVMGFCRVICSSVPVMEQDDYVREALEKKADEYEGLLNPPSKKGKVVDKHDNVVVLSFEPDAKDKTQ